MPSWGGWTKRERPSSIFVPLRPRLCLLFRLTETRNTASSSDRVCAWQRVRLREAPPVSRSFLATHFRGNPRTERTAQGVCLSTKYRCVVRHRERGLVGVALRFAGTYRRVCRGVSQGGDGGGAVAPR